MSDATNVVIQNENYLRIVTIFQVCVKQALLDILHDPIYNGLPLNNEQQAHALLLAFRIREEKHLRGVLKPPQWDIICHVCTNTCGPHCSRVSRTNTEDFDITIICVLLRNYLVNLPPPTNGWKQPLAPGDYSKNACGIRARELRNRTTGHGSYHQIANQQKFNDCYSEINLILKGLGYYNMQLFIDLKTSSLDPYAQSQIKFLSRELKANQDLMKTEFDLYKDKQDALVVQHDNSVKLIEELKIKQRDFEQFCKIRNFGTTSLTTTKNWNNPNLVSEKLKKQYQKKYGEMRLSLEPRKSSFQPVPTIERNNIVVKLSLVPSPTVFRMSDESQSIEMIREKQKHSASISIVYKDMFESNNDYVLISGVPGCGKTTLVENILYEWSTDQLFKEEFEFMFIIYFRQLVKFRSDPKLTSYEILSHFYPVFDFSKILHHKSLLILDGFDEFACKEDFLKTNEEFSPFVQAVYDLVDPCLLTQFTRLLTSRPGSFPILFKSTFNGTFEQKLRIFKIMGFDNENIEKYVNNHVKSANRAKELLTKVEESPYLQSFMIIPFYCWGICYLIQNEEYTLDNLPVTTTAISANLLTLFIRNHGLRNPALKFKDLIELKEFQEMVFMLSNMAWMFHKERRLVFNSIDLKEFDNIDVLVKSGLVIKVESDFEDSDFFQFMHYSFQEFLCALHAFYKNETLNVYNSLTANMKKMVAGLCGGTLQNSTSDPIVKLYAGITDIRFDIGSLFISIVEIEELFDYLFEFQNESEKVSIEYLRLVYPTRTIPKLHKVKLDHFKKRSNNGNLSIDTVKILSEPYSMSDMSHESLFPILSCCKTLEFNNTFTLVVLLRQFDFNRVKEAGRLDNLHLYCHQSLGSPHLSQLLLLYKEWSEFSKFICCLKSVKILVSSLFIDDEMINSFKSFKIHISTMKESERPTTVNLYHVNTRREDMEMMNRVWAKRFKVNLCMNV